MPAGSTKAQMDPGVAQPEAFLATAAMWVIRPHEIQMLALLSHDAAHT